MERAWFTACWHADAGDFPPPGGLSVLDTVPADSEACAIAFPYYGDDRATTPFVAWELEDAEGKRWLVQFSIAGLSSNVLAPGDVVEFNYQVDSGGIERGPKGFVALEREGRPVVALGINQAPPGVHLDPAEADCDEYEELHCNVERAARVTVTTETAVVPIGEIAELGGLKVANGYLADHRECDVIRDPLDFELGAYMPK